MTSVNISPLFQNLPTLPALPSQQPPKLLDQIRNKIRFKHYSLRTEQAYLDWIRRFILFHHQRHPTEMGGPEVKAFLTHLAVVGKVAASTQKGSPAFRVMGIPLTRFAKAVNIRPITLFSGLPK